MEVAYRRNIGQSFLVIREEGIQPDYRTQMCKKNRIEPFLSMETERSEGKLEFWYDITGKQSLEEYIRHEKLGAEKLWELLGGICEGIKEAENYLLPEQSILLQSEYIYVANNSNRFFLCYYPGEEGNLSEKFHSLMEYLLPYIDHGERQAVGVGYRVYQMTLEPNYGVEAIQELLEEILIPEDTDKQEEGKAECEEAPCETERRDRDAAAFVTGNTEEKHKKEIERQDIFGGKWLKKGRQFLRTGKQIVSGFSIGRNGYKKQMVFEPMEETEREAPRKTVFLGKDKEEKKMKMLVYMGDERDRDVMLEQDIYCIGSREDVDILILDEAVSRLHARINKADGIYYIEDLNSRNGTWVNGNLLHYMEKLPLQDGDILCFAEERYQYQEK